MLRRSSLAVLSLFLSSFLLISCTKPHVADWRLYKLHYENSSGEQGVTIFDLSDKHASLAVWEMLDGSRYSLNELIYDGEGNLVRKERQFSDGPTSETIYRYENGHLVYEAINRSDGVTGEVDYLYEGDTLVLADCRGLKGWFFGKLQYTHDANGRAIGAMILRDGEEIGEIEFQYDEQGNQILERWQTKKGWSQTFRREFVQVGCEPCNYGTSNGFIRNVSGWRIAEEKYDWSGKGGGPSFYEYADRTNRLIRKRFVRDDGLETITRYLYGARGELIRSFRAFADGRFGLFRYGHDDHLRLLEREYFQSDELFGYERFSYDEKGQLVGAHYEKMDSWLTGDLTFTTDANGFLSSGTFTGSGAREGLDAKIEFNVNERGQPLRIHWDFGSGGSQTYRFEYEKYSVK